MSDADRKAAEAELAAAQGNDEQVKAAEKRLAAAGGDRTAEPEEAKPARSRQTKRD